jgi:hypothetical protein
MFWHMQKLSEDHEAKMVGPNIFISLVYYLVECYCSRTSYSSSHFRIPNVPNSSSLVRKYERGFARLMQQGGEPILPLL